MRPLQVRAPKSLLVCSASAAVAADLGGEVAAAAAAPHLAVQSASASFVTPLSSLPLLASTVSSSLPPASSPPVFQSSDDLRKHFEALLEQERLKTKFAEVRSAHTAADGCACFSALLIRHQDSN